MNAPNASESEGYEAFYRDFDSPLMCSLRREAYGEDVGQHSWVTAAELRAAISHLELTASSRFLDLGSGPCGPLTFVLATVGCSGTGVEISPAALEAGRRRADVLRVDHLLTTRQADLDQPLPLESASFDAAMSLDVLLHLRDRATFFRETARVLTPGGRFLLTDAGVITGSVSNDEVHRRSAHGPIQLVVTGWNERLLEAAGFRLIQTEDRTANVLQNAGGRLAVLQRRRAEFEQAWGAVVLQSQQRYLEVVVEWARRKAVSRIAYVAELRG